LPEAAGRQELSMRRPYFSYIRVARGCEVDSIDADGG
jgi:hypothetical protein